MFSAIRMGVGNRREPHDAGEGQRQDDTDINGGRIHQAGADGGQGQKTQIVSDPFDDG